MIDISKYKFVRNIGQTTYRNVRLYVHIIDNSYIVAKETEKSIEEIEKMIKLSNIHIIEYYGYFYLNGKLNLAMEYAFQGNLYELVNNRFNQFSEKELLNLFLEICLGMQYLHKHKIILGFLKTKDILNCQGSFKIGDTDIIKNLNFDKNISKRISETFVYCSPEIILQKGYDYKADIWSLGCILFEITNLKRAFEIYDPKTTIDHIIKGQYSKFRESKDIQYSEDLFKLIGGCLSVDPDDRPSINQIINSPLIILNLSLSERRIIFRNKLLSELKDEEESEENSKEEEKEVKKEFEMLEEAKKEYGNEEVKKEQGNEDERKKEENIQENIDNKEIISFKNLEYIEDSECFRKRFEKIIKIEEIMEIKKFSQVGINGKNIILDKKRTDIQGNSINKICICLECSRYIAPIKKESSPIILLRAFIDFNKLKNHIKNQKEKLYGKIINIELKYKNWRLICFRKNGEYFFIPKKDLDEAKEILGLKVIKYEYENEKIKKRTEPFGDNDDIKINNIGEKKTNFFIK